MFENVENKLKSYAKVNFFFVIVIACLAAIFILVEVLNHTSPIGVLLVLILYAALVYDLLALCWFMYAFAEITESTKKTNEALQLTFAKQITIEQKRRQKEQEAADEQSRMEEAQRKADEEAQAAERKRRYDAYWELHVEERNALLTKKKEAENALKSISGLAAEERIKLRDLISAIDDELNKER